MAQKNAAGSKTTVRRIIVKYDGTKQPSPHTSKATAPTKKTTSKTAKKTVAAATASPKQPKTTAKKSTKKSGDVGYFKGA